MGFLADKCTFRLLTRELIDTCKPREKQIRRYPAVLIGRLGVDVHFAGFSFLFKDDEQEALSAKMKLPLKTRYMYFDLIEVVRK